jgi:hypothetical protein
LTFDGQAAQPRPRVRQYLVCLLERLLAAVRSAARLQSPIVAAPCLELVGSALALIRDPLKLVGSALALIRDPLALVGPPVSFVCATLSLVKLAQELQPAVSLDPRALGSVVSPLGGLALPNGIIFSSTPRACLSVLCGKTSALLKHVSRSNEDRCQTRRVLPLAELRACRSRFHGRSTNHRNASQRRRQAQIVKELQTNAKGWNPDAKTWRRTSVRSVQQSRALGLLTTSRSAV